jgi:hypothetical protein
VGGTSISAVSACATLTSIGASAVVGLRAENGMGGANVSGVEAPGTCTSIGTLPAVGPPAENGFEFALNVIVAIVLYFLICTCGNRRTFLNGEHRIPRESEGLKK